MFQKLAVDGFEWVEDSSQFNEDFIKSCNEKSDEGYFLEVGIQHPEEEHDLHNDLPFLPKRIKIEKVKKLVENLHNKTEYVIHIKNLKQVLNHGLILKKVYRIIKSYSYTYSYLIDDGSEDKKAKGTKKCVIKRKVKFENYKHCLQATKLENKINHPKKN